MDTLFLLVWQSASLVLKGPASGSASLEFKNRVFNKFVSRSVILSWRKHSWNSGCLKALLRCLACRQIARGHLDRRRRKEFGIVGCVALEESIINL